MVDSNSESNDSKYIRPSVFALLKENPSFSPKMICAKLHLPYVTYGGYVNNLKSYWKSHYEFEQGSNCSSVHAWSGWCYVPQHVDRVLALEAGWKPTNSKNHWLLWKDKVGRMMWFENGRVNLHVKSPVNLGKVKQLVSNGFDFTGPPKRKRVTALTSQLYIRLKINSFLAPEFKPFAVTCSIAN